jgi:phospholipase C
MRLAVCGILFFVGTLLAQTQTSVAAGSRVSPFKHVVVIFQENRTPDNLFQGLCVPPYGTAASCSAKPGPGQYDIQTGNWLDNKSSGGVIQPGLVALANKYDLSHAHSAFRAMCDADPTTGVCKMDGAAGVVCSGTCLTTPQFRYVDNSTGILNPYLDLATQYGWGNFMFQTNQGPSFPAHQYIFGATSAPSAADDAAGIFAAENMSNTGISGTSAIAGCIADSTTTVQLVGPSGVENASDKIYPCFEHQTVADVLPSNVTWRYYAPGAGSIWTAPDAIQHICQSTGPGGKCVGSLWNANVDLVPADVLKDIASCNLRSLTWVIPSGLNSDHANGNDGGGPSWVASIVNAIGTSTGCDGGAGYWKDTAILITWDDWGGWYDHEPPTILNYPQGGYQLGFRVPLIVVSPYTPKGYINNVRHDFGSLLRFIENNFGIKEGVLNFADARATNDLSAFFDYSLPPRVFQPISSPLTASFFLNDTRALTDPDDQ